MGEMPNPHIPHIPTFPTSATVSARTATGKAFGVSGKSVDYAKKVIDKGIPELAKAADEGRNKNANCPGVAIPDGSSRILVASVQNGGFFEASTPASSGSPKSSLGGATFVDTARTIGALSTGISLPSLRPRRA